LFFTVVNVFSQNLSSIRTKKITVKNDTIILDTLSIVPNSLIITDSLGNVIDTNAFIIDVFKSEIYLNSQLFNNIKESKIIIRYRIFNYNFSKKYFNKDYSLLTPNELGYSNPFSFSYKDNEEEIFDFGNITKSGSISRGISFGNGQDVIVNSNLDLQLSGKLNENYRILASITDENIPIQPEGNTQTLQEFDKVFIQVYNENTKIIAGDYEQKPNNSYFMQFNKKLQGALVSTKIPLKNSKNEFNITTSGAVSKGKFARNQLKQLEGNQGPYKLVGADNERFLIVLAGSEKVYIDGKMLKRGQDNDYVIDYNSAEITFTPKQIITKDKRIIVEFEYSDKNYSRSLFYVNSEYKTEKLKINLNLFSEQDGKNKPINQQLSSEDKKLLSNIGDSIQLAFIKNIDSVEFSSEDVLYKMTDTIVYTNITYDSVFVYSNNPDIAYYKLGFSFVGDNKGNYNLIQTATNGRVYKWIAPDSLTGMPQGNYEPVMLIVTPKKQQMATLTLDYQISKSSKLMIEGAISTNDINTFSSKGANDNNGYAFKTNYIFEKALSKAKKDSWKINSNLNYEYVNVNFKELDKFRNIEFERDWNLTNVNENNDENLVGAEIVLKHDKTGFLGYNADMFFIGNNYNAIKNEIKTNLNKGIINFTFNGSLMNSEHIDNTTEFLRHNAKISANIKQVTVGVSELSENNMFYNLNTLQNGSYKFNELEYFVKNKDTATHNYYISYKNREDYTKIINDIKKVSKSEDISFSYLYIKKSVNVFKSSIIYRNLNVVDSTFAIQNNIKSDNSLIGRLDFQNKILKGFIAFNSFYEIGSGMEAKKEFRYIKVADGQGTYIWKDYNGNGVEEIYEFEPFKHQDEANYIRVYYQTNEYIRVYTNSYNQLVSINPALLFKNPKGAKKFISRFSDNIAYQTERKITLSEFNEKVYNPFYDNKTQDTGLVSINQNFKNIFYFNKTSSKFGMEYNIKQNKNKVLMVNGYDSKNLFETEYIARVTLHKKFTIKGKYGLGTKTNNTDYSEDKNYEIGYYEYKPEFIFQPNTNFRISAFYKYIEKNNRLGSKEKAINQHLTTEIKLSKAEKGALLLNISYIENKFNGNSSNSIAYEMLEGLQPGNNYTWGVSYQKTLAKSMQLSLMYNGRKANKLSVIHTGSVQVRAFF